MGIDIVWPISKRLMCGDVGLGAMEEPANIAKRVRAAIEGIRAVCDLPIAVTLSFETRGHTMMGVHPTAAAEALRQRLADHGQRTTAPIVIHR